MTASNPDTRPAAVVMLAAGKGTRIGVDQAGGTVKAMPTLRIERTVRLEVVELARAEAGHEDAPDVSPAVLCGVEGDHFGGLEVVNRVVEQDPHRRRRMAVDDKLHAASHRRASRGQRTPTKPRAVMQHRSVRQRVRKLERWQTTTGVASLDCGCVRVWNHQKRS